MTQPFNPKFVDMVRVNSSTVGTGPLVCGTAVPGFASFAEALVAGDSFYYSVQGVERPQEREVGRGTYQANNTITRQPLLGALTNFSTGTKTIALVAASEWYSRLQEVSALPAVRPISSRATLKSLVGMAQGDVRALTEKGRAGEFQWDPGVPVATHQADPLEGIYVAPNSAAAGAWVRRFSGGKDARWFGAVGDGVANDGPALQAWLDSGGQLFLPAALFLSSQKLIVRRHVVVEGAGYGFSSQIANGPARNHPGSRISFAAGVGGIEVQPSTLLLSKSAVDGAGSSAWTQEGAFQCVLRNLALIGAGTGVAATGFYSRTLCYLDNVHVLRFTGKGFDLSAAADMNDAGAEYGNASLSRFINCQATDNGSHGFHVRGRDASVVKLDTCNARGNGGWGFLDDGLLGNTYINCHVATNALGSFRATSQVAPHTYIGCYVEIDGGKTASLGSVCTVRGGSLSQCLTGDSKASGNLGFRFVGKSGIQWMGNGNGNALGAIPSIAAGIGPTEYDYADLVGYHIGWSATGDQGGTDLNFQWDYGHRYNSGSGSYTYGAQTGAVLWRDPTRNSTVARAYARGHEQGIFIGANFAVRLGSFDSTTTLMPDGAYRAGDTFISRDTTVANSSLFRVAQASGIVCATAWAAGQQFFSAPPAPYAASYRVNGSNVYRLASVTTPNAPATDAPVHVAGTVVGADGYGWQFMNAVGAVTFRDVLQPDGSITLGNDILKRSGGQAVIFARAADTLIYGGTNGRFGFVSPNLSQVFGVNVSNTDGSATFDQSVNLASGRELRVNGQRVVGGRGAALPPDATDLASAIALVNAMKARLRVTGGHGLVAD